MKNYIFDFDGTLADSGSTAIFATQAAFKKVGLIIPSEELIEHYMGIPIEISFRKMANKDFTDKEFEDLLNNFRDNYKKFEIENLRLFTDMDKVLSELYKNEKNLFVVSSKHSTALIRNLEQLKILKYFKGVSGSDNVENFKPAPDGILNILKRFNINKEDTVMIGDATYDLQMGRSADVKSCGVTWGAHKVEELKNENPDYLISDVKEILNL
ncbi:HAD family hydrolase [Clostridium sp. AL.422]|uniref:HAD family hydrolase n=1 Tax=Clostridium TaxID=1485 RepID=UPI00293DA7AF|nr:MULTISPECIES: HAD family hydrolase [unclassified Clostridium]MDV4149377.1 HAD family hydrolase [Clostridium sp. AL.422]